MRTLGGICVIAAMACAGCGAEQSAGPSFATAVERRANAPRSDSQKPVVLAEAEESKHSATAGFIRDAAVRTPEIDAWRNRDANVRPADFAWQGGGPDIPTPYQQLNPNAAWNANGPQRQSSVDQGKPPESLYPRGADLLHRATTSDPVASTPWTLPAESKQAESPPQNAPGLSLPFVVDSAGADDQRASGYENDQAILASADPESAQNRRSWQSTPWEQGQRVAYAPRAGTRPELPTAVALQVRSLTQEAFELAGRGAQYSAREKMVRALEMVALSLDAAEGSDRRRLALRSAFRAMDEATDFTPRGSVLLTEIDVSTAVSGHLTPVLHQPEIDLDRISAVACSRAYLTYAQQQLITSCDTQQSASLALYGLGKLNAALDGNYVDTASRSVVFHQAALAVDSGNWRAANELAVQLVRNSRYEEARGWLQHATQLSQSPELWANLAVVHGHLGEERLANAAASQSQRLAQRTQESTSASGVSVQWVAPEAFTGTPVRMP